MTPTTTIASMIIRFDQTQTQYEQQQKYTTKKYKQLPQQPKQEQ